MLGHGYDHNCVMCSTAKNMGLMKKPKDSKAESDQKSEYEEKEVADQQHSHNH